MEYYLYPPFFDLKTQDSFDDTWEVFCCELLNLENSTQDIYQTRPPDLGADLRWDEKHTIYQCKATGKATPNGQAGKLNISEILASIQRAKENQQRIGWEKYVLCINVVLTGDQNDRIKKALPEIKILNRAHWVELCQRFHQTHPVTSRFNASHSLPEPFSRIPAFLENRLFTGREEVLEQIFEKLSAEKMLALTGLGGIGKTQCAAKYAFLHYKQEYHYVIWAIASTRETLTKSYIDLASRLHLSKQISMKNELGRVKIVEAVKQWLQEHDNWLLIADDAENLDVTFGFLPSTHTGHILLTRREAAGRRIPQIIEIPKMEGDKGILMLLRLAKVLPHNASLDQVDQQDREQARMIVREMDGLPLALDQAGAYIEENQSSLVEYLEAYKDKHKQIDLLKRRGGFTGDHPDSVATTWSLNFEQVEKNSLLAADVMRVCAFLAPDDIPEDIFVKGADTLGPELRTLTNDPTLLRNAVGELRRFSLVRRNTDKRTLSIHRLVQVVVRSALKENEQEEWAKRVVYVLQNLFPSSSDGASWEVCQQYLPHALACFDLIQQYNITSIEAALLLQNVANYQSERASYDTVDTVKHTYQHARTIIEQHHPHHDALANILYDFARFYYEQGNYEQAELLLQRATTIKEQDADEITIARNNNLLAACYYQQKNYEQAEELLKLALNIYEQSLGNKHPDTAMSLNNLATLYYAQGDYKSDAYETDNYELEDYELEDYELGDYELENYEPEDYEPGKYEQAEMLFKRALTIHENSSGRDHYNTAMVLNNLAALYYVQEKYEQAEQHLQRALDIYERSLGPNHPSTAMSLNNLAELYHTQEKYEQAETYYKRALAICDRLLGSDHHSTVIVRNNYMLLQSRKEQI